MTTTYNILVVDSDKRTRDLLTDALKAKEFVVFAAKTWEEGFLLFKKNNIHLVICEGYFPDTPDFLLLEKIREMSRIPVVIVSLLTNELHRIHAFQAYADDYVVKPFSVDEVLLRVKRLLSYFYQERTTHQVGNRYIFPFMQVDVFERQLFIHNKKVTLTPLQFDLLRYFVEHPDTVLSRKQLLEDVWKYGIFGEERTVDAQIKTLRQTLRVYSEDAAASIETEWGRGYRFNPYIVERKQN